MQVACTDEFSLCLDYRRRLWILGGAPESLFEDNQADVTPRLYNLANEQLVQFVSCGSRHVCYCTTDGALWSFGDNKNGKLGLNANVELTQPPRRVNLSNIVSVHCGLENTICIDSMNTLYGFGRNICGELGLNTDEPVIWEPNPITSLQNCNIISVSGGEFHTLFLDASGQVYSCGLNTEGQLGQNDKKDRALPTKIDRLSKVSQIATGRTFSVILRENNVFVCGYNYGGCLGLQTLDNQISFVKVPKLPPIEFIDCGWSHTTCISTKGEVWVFGILTNNNTTSSASDTHFPTKVSKIENAVSSGSGRDYCFVIGSDSIWTFGSNKSGRLGQLGAVVSKDSPEKLADSVAHEILTKSVQRAKSARK